MAQGKIEYGKNVGISIYFLLIRAHVRLSVRSFLYLVMLSNEENQRFLNGPVTQSIC